MAPKETSPSRQISTAAGASSGDTAQALFALATNCVTVLWAPETRTAIGMAARSVSYALNGLGWALSLLPVAGFSGIVRSR